MNDINELHNYLCKYYELNPSSTYVAIVEGEKSQTLHDFFKEVSIAFKFPDYFSWNMNSFLEIMNDLSWLNKSDYILLIRNPSLLLQEDSTENQDVKYFFEKIKTEWRNVPNYEGEDIYRKKSKFILHYAIE